MASVTASAVSAVATRVRSEGWFVIPAKAGIQCLAPKDTGSPPQPVLSAAEGRGRQLGQVAATSAPRHDRVRLGDDRVDGQIVRRKRNARDELRIVGARHTRRTRSQQRQQPVVIAAAVAEPSAVPVERHTGDEHPVDALGCNRRRIGARLGNAAIAGHDVGNGIGQRMQRQHTRRLIDARQDDDLACRKRSAHERQRVPLASEREREQHRVRVHERGQHGDARQYRIARGDAVLDGQCIAPRKQIATQRGLRLVQRGAVRRCGSVGGGRHDGEWYSERPHRHGGARCERLYNWRLLREPAMDHQRHVYRHRRDALLDQMRKQSDSGLALVPTAPEIARNRDSHFPFRHDSYFYYLTGFPEPEAVVALVAGPDGDRQVLFCREKNQERETWDGFRYGPDAAREIFGFDEAHPISELDERLPVLAADQPALYTPLGLFADWDKRITDLLNEVRNRVRMGVTAPSEIVDVRDALDAMRLVKDTQEIALMRRANAISSAAHRRAMAATRVGWYEYQVEGKFAGPQKAVYELVLAAQQACIDAVRPGADFHDYHKVAERVLAQGFIDLGLIGGTLDEALESGSFKQFYMHRAGHWLGMDVHDAGLYQIKGASQKLTPGMVLTVEPGAYIRRADNVPEPFWDIGVRIEDDVLVTETGVENLTAATPKAVADVEAACGSR